jgi:hypothetical protein
VSPQGDTFFSQLYIASTFTTNLPLCAYISSFVYNLHSYTQPLDSTLHTVRRSPWLCAFCTFSLHTFHIILLTKPSSVSLPSSCPVLCMLRIPTKRFGREGITRVPFSGDLDFQFVPEAGNPDRAFSPEMNVAIYFKSHHGRLVLQGSHISVVPVYYLRTLFPLFHCLLHTISGYLFTLFHCIV